MHRKNSSQADPCFSGAYVQIPAAKWRSLAATTELPLTDEDVRRLAALGDPIDIAQADAIYRPLSALMQMYAKSTRELLHESTDFIGFPESRTPWIIGIAGSVAVGKSTAARLLRELMSRWPQTPNVDLITTDGFLLPNAKLTELGIMHRKGFPESYDRRALLDFLHDVKSGKPNLQVPVYDHVTYDIVPDKFITVNQPQILIVEGLNVLQPPRASTTDGEFRAVSDYFDFSIYLDAAEADLEKWYLQRMLALKAGAFADSRSFFRKYANLSEQEVLAMGREVWRSVNLPNLREHIAPTRSRATVILSKATDHTVKEVFLRRL
ncbi:type I pantothenate kinase [Arcanobacterium hippocoleae]|uniref:Pantothenate kinase n=1 Tax=Arcanobacterium hippocoleae TaxID=149017 RepID=A0ABU1T3X0_9ACTO|nr:type I pantothenate kinase [Arcanobacterium hippocoleae]MDR6940086.1 type I pantothenate kinase [Arcanobacterium hippocoleae]